MAQNTKGISIKALLMGEVGWFTLMEKCMKAIGTWIRLREWVSINTKMVQYMKASGRKTSSMAKDLKNGQTDRIYSTLFKAFRRKLYSRQENWQGEIHVGGWLGLRW